MTWTSHCLRPFQMLMFTVSLFNSDSNQECDQKSLEELLRLRTAALLLGPWFPGGGHDAPPPPSLLSWAWVASLATISWLSSTPIMLTISLCILQLVDIYCLTIRLTNRLSIIVFCHKVSLVTVLLYENVVNTGSNFKHDNALFYIFWLHPYTWWMFC